MLTLKLVNDRTLANQDDCVWHFRRVKKIDTVIFQVERILERNNHGGPAPDLENWPTMAKSYLKTEFSQVKGHFLMEAYRRIGEIEKAEGKFPHQRMTQDV